MTSWFQKRLTLAARARGSYLVTDEIVSQLPELTTYKVGILHLFIQHTSCALSLNENFDEDVRADMSDALDRIVPTDRRGDLYRHSAEGEDDMPVSTSFKPPPSLSLFSHAYSLISFLSFSIPFETFPFHIICHPCFFRTNFYFYFFTSFGRRCVHRYSTTLSGLKPTFWGGRNLH